MVPDYCSAFAEDVIAPLTRRRATSLPRRHRRATATSRFAVAATNNLVCLWALHGDVSSPSFPRVADLVLLAQFKRPTVLVVYHSRPEQHSSLPLLPHQRSVLLSLQLTFPSVPLQLPTPPGSLTSDMICSRALNFLRKPHGVATWRRFFWFWLHECVPCEPFQPIGLTSFDLLPRSSAGAQTVHKAIGAAFQAAELIEKQAEGKSDVLSFARRVSDIPDSLKADPAKKPDTRNKVKKGRDLSEVLGTFEVMYFGTVPCTEMRGQHVVLQRLGMLLVSSVHFRVTTSRSFAKRFRRCLTRPSVLNT